MRSKDRLRNWTLLLVCALIPLASLSLLLERLSEPLDLAPDAALYLQTGQLMLSGKIPYVDFVELNPPLIMYISYFPAWLSEQTSLHSIVVFKGFIVVITLICALLSVAVLWPLLKEKDNRTALVVLLVICAFLGHQFGFEFGQREHLFVYLYLPFFLLRWRRWQGDNIELFLAITCGATAGVGIALKHYFLIFPLLTEGYWMLSSKRFRALLQPEIYSLLAIGFAYGLHFLFLPTGMRKGFFEGVVPLLLSGYDAFNTSLERALFLEDYWFRALFMVMVLPLGFLLRKQHSLIMPISMWILAGWLVNVIQCKGWPYHTLPIAAGIAMLAGIELVVLAKPAVAPLAKRFKEPDEVDAFCRTLFERSTLVALLLVFSLLFLNVLFNLGNLKHGLALTFTGASRQPSPELARELSSLASVDETGKWLSAYTQRGDRVLFLDPGVFPAFPRLVQFDRLPGSRYIFLFPVPMIAYAIEHSGSSARRMELERDKHEFLSELLADTRRFRPKLILLKKKLYSGCPDGFSLKAYLDEDGSLSKMLAGYRKIGESLNFEAFVRN